MLISRVKFVTTEFDKPSLTRVNVLKRMKVRESYLTNDSDGLFPGERHEVAVDGDRVAVNLVGPA